MHAMPESAWVVMMSHLGSLICEKIIHSKAVNTLAKQKKVLFMYMYIRESNTFIHVYAMSITKKNSTYIIRCYSPVLLLLSLGF